MRGYPSNLADRKAIIIPPTPPPTQIPRLHPLAIHFFIRVHGGASTGFAPLSRRCCRLDPPAGYASRGARAPLLLIALVAERNERKRARVLDVPIPACMCVRPTPEQKAGARRHDAGRRDAVQKTQPFGSWQRMRGAGSERRCTVPCGENQPPRLRMRRLRAPDWFAVQPAARCRWRCGYVVAVDARPRRMAHALRYACRVFAHRSRTRAKAARITHL